MPAEGDFPLACLISRENFPNRKKRFQDEGPMISYAAYVPGFQGIFGTFLGTAVVASPV